MGKGFLSLATATILNAVANGYSFGFDIVDMTGMPGGTVYPALRRLEEGGYLTSRWEKEQVAHAELRPRRRYYEITRAGRQALAAAVGRGSATWRAYLSTQGPNAVNARDRIGNGPWHNQKGQLISRDQAQLHGDTIELARVGPPIAKFTALTEQGTPVSGSGDNPNQHDILTGSTPDGRAFDDGADRTCRNWTANGDGSAQVGHSDRTGGPSASWNSTHLSRGCGQEQLRASGGAGLFYCFAGS